MQFKAFLNGRALTVYPARMSAFPLTRVWSGRQRPLDQTAVSVFVTFDLETDSELRIEIPEPGPSAAEIRPLESDIPRRIEGNFLILRLSHPCQFTVETGGRQNALHVFVNPPFREEHGHDELVFGPGEHDAGILVPHSGQTIRIEEGAVVYGAVFAYRADNVRIVGRGILDSSRLCRGNDVSQGESEFLRLIRRMNLTERDAAYMGSVVAYGCKNFVMDGVILRDSPFWTVIIRNGCRDVRLNNIKLIGQWRYNSDGIDVCSSENTVIRNSFIRTFDDCIVARNACLDGESGDLDGLTVENCVLACDWGKSLEVWLGDHTGEIRNVLFRNCSLIHLSAIAMDVTTWFGSRDSRARNIRFENITVNLGEKFYSQQIQNADGERYLWKTDCQPLLIVINCDRLGVNLGNQACKRTKTFSDYSILYENIRFSGIHCIGSGSLLPALVSSKFEQHRICKVELTDTDVSEVRISGNVRDFSLNSK